MHTATKAFVVVEPPNKIAGEQPNEIASASTSPEFIRRTHISTETSVKAIGWLILLGGGVGMFSLFANSAPTAGLQMLWGLAMSVVAIVAGILMVTLNAMGRLIYTGLVLVNLAQLAFNAHSVLATFEHIGDPQKYLMVSALTMLFALAFPAWFLSILWSRKGRMVLSPRYRDEIVPLALGVRFRTRAWWLLAILLAEVGFIYFFVFHM